MGKPTPLLGYTVPEIDKVLEPYCEKSYKFYYEEYIENALRYTIKPDIVLADEFAMNKIKRDLEQGFQGLEIKLNTVASSRGDYPFTTFTCGEHTTKFGCMITEALLKVRKEGQGKEGFKRVLPFPKIVFLYTDKLHGKGKEYEWLFDRAIECSSKAMYPDYLSLDEGNTGRVYQQYKQIISPMGCRAYLSDWYEQGGMQPKDENDKPVFVGRFNVGE